MHPNRGGGKKWDKGRKLGPNGRGQPERAQRMAQHPASTSGTGRSCVTQPSVSGVSNVTRGGSAMSQELQPRTDAQDRKAVVEPLGGVDSTQSPCETSTYYYYSRQEILQVLHKSKLMSTVDKQKWSKATSIPAEVTLSKAPNAWQPSWKKEQDSTDRMKKDIRVLLNQVTIKTVNIVSEKMQQIMNSFPDEAMVDETAEMIYEKAIQEPMICSVYGVLCASLLNKGSRTSAQHSLTEQIRKRLLRCLLTRCQNRFEEWWNMKKEQFCTDQGDPDVAEAEYEDQRQRSLGNACLIGELYNSGVLSTAIIVRCCARLSTDVRDHPIELLSKLVNVAGEKMWQSADANEKRVISAAFDMIEKTNANPELSTRGRCIVLDLKDLRQQNFVKKKK